MSDYEQMEIDVRLESEKDLKTNVGKVIKFFYDKRRLEAEESGWPLKQVKSKHEGYGIAAEAFSKIGAKMKALDRGMKDYLALLQVKGEDGVSICGNIYSQALELAMEAIGMAADAGGRGLQICRAFKRLLCYHHHGRAARKQVPPGKH